MIDITKYRTAETSWSVRSGLGNHRFLIEAPRAEYVKAQIKWRRHDRLVDTTGLRLRYGKRRDGIGENEIFDIIAEDCDRESVSVIFRAPTSGVYELYYLPFELSGEAFSPSTEYMPRDAMRPSEDWLCGLGEAEPCCGSVIGYEARSDFDSFYPMELAMTAKEALAFTGETLPFIAVAESRLRPVRMRAQLPAVWCTRSADERRTLSDRAAKNEHYAFQAVLYARERLENVRIRFYDSNGAEYSCERVICFSTDGVDTRGKPFSISRSAEAGELLPLWCGVRCECFDSAAVDIHICITADNTTHTEQLSVQLELTDELLEDNGDGELWRMSRLFWLNSDIGLSNDVIPPYTPPVLSGDGKSISILGRTIAVGRLGLPSQITGFFDEHCRLDESCEPSELFSSPMTLSVCENGTLCDAAITHSECTHSGGMESCLVRRGTFGALCFESDVTYEADGHIDCKISLSANSDGEYSFELSSCLRSAAVPYMMGMCRFGGKVPNYWEYRWDAARDGNEVWLGGMRLGMKLKLMQEDEHWRGASPLPRLWANGGRGKFTLRRDACSDTVTLSATTGKCHLAAGQTEVLHFHILITPFHPIELEHHYTEHYYHKNTWNSTESIPSLERARELGCTSVILHQGGPLNENINYPFLLADRLRDEVKTAHSMGLKYKLYYTVRELSNRAAELWALRSLGDEIFCDDGDARIADFFAADAEKKRSRGGPWLCEHLCDSYTPAWQQKLQNGELDCAIKTQSCSRWHNYYLKGLDYLMRRVGIDGIYLDGIGYDRHIMRRVRRVMLAASPTCDIDIHNGNEHSSYYQNGCSACIYMEHFPYADSLWNGEGFDCDAMSPDAMLTEVSGLPFGLMNEMLEGGGNPFRGMLFGMTARCGWSQGGTSSTIWESIWKPFGIEHSRLFGFWDPRCPVVTEYDEIPASVYVNDAGDVLVCLASWYAFDVETAISVDREALGLCGEYELYAPQICEMKPYDRLLPWDRGDLSTPEGYLQEERVFREGESIPVKSGGGYMLFLRQVTDKIIK